MQCPNCLEHFHIDWRRKSTDAQQHSGALSTDRDYLWHFRYCVCPACRRAIVFLGKTKLPPEEVRPSGHVRPTEWYLVEPRVKARKPLPKDVPTQYVNDYKEACDVLEISPKASAALSRRCLQSLLGEKADVKKENLSHQIQAVLDRSVFPPYLADAIDGIRAVGNFAAHPIKSTSTGQIIEVEPGEAEWNLSVLEQLFDFFFVQPATRKRNRDQVNEKLQRAGKPPLKGR